MIGLTQNCTIYLEVMKSRPVDQHKIESLNSTLLFLIIFFFFFSLLETMELGIQ